MCTFPAEFHEFVLSAIAVRRLREEANAEVSGLQLPLQAFTLSLRFREFSLQFLALFSEFQVFLTHAHDARGRHSDSAAETRRGERNPLDKTAYHSPVFVVQVVAGRCRWVVEHQAFAQRTPLSPVGHLILDYTREMGGARSRAACQTQHTSLFDIPFQDLDGGTQTLAQFRGKVLLITNVASKCGMTMKYYHQFEDLQKRYESRGFTVLGFPCNQFFRQEHSASEQIRAFLADNGVTFPVFARIDVNGKGAHDLFKFLRMNSPLNCGKIGWNFGKFLVDREGRVTGYYGPRTEPNEMIPDIEKTL